MELGLALLPCVLASQSRKKEGERAPKWSSVHALPICERYVHVLYVTCTLKVHSLLCECEKAALCCFWH